jgi:hypothetical protein
MNQQTTRTGNEKRKSLKQKLFIVLIGAILTLCFTCIIGTWLSNRTKSTRELLGPLTKTQRICTRQIVGDGTLVHVEKNQDNIAIGYFIDDDLYVSIFNTSQDDTCNVEFQERVWHCYDLKSAEYCDKYGYDIEPKKILQVELTDNASQEVYVWFDARGPGRNGNAHHIFYVEQPDHSYEPIFILTLCTGLSSVEIDKESKKIIATDDMNCDMFHGRKEVIECSILDGTSHCKLIKHDMW